MPTREGACPDDGLAERVGHRAEDPIARGDPGVDGAAGADAWNGLPDDARRVLTGNGAALLAELRAYEGARLDIDALGRLDLPLLLAAAQEPVFSLAGALHGARLVVVPGGHPIDPAGPEVIAVVDDVLGPGAGDPQGLSRPATGPPRLALH